MCWGAMGRAPWGWLRAIVFQNGDRGVPLVSPLTGKQLSLTMPPRSDHSTRRSDCTDAGWCAPLPIRATTSGRLFVEPSIQLSLTKEVEFVPLSAAALTQVLNFRELVV